jgi:hypothetical protein
MSDYVLKAPRSAPSNATTTAGASSGVARAHADLPPSYGLPGTLVEASADQYRASVLDAATETVQEYLLWTANSSNLSIVEDPTWATADGSGAIPTGTLTVGSRKDGTDRVVVTDNGGRTIAGILSVIAKRGDTGAEFTFTTFASTNPMSGVVVLDAAALVVLGGGLSNLRGDTIIGVSYYVAAQRFWWTRNDAQATRFAWNGKAQKWAPIKGTAPVGLGRILATDTYTLIPRPSRYAVGDYLPGDPVTPDAYATVRVGRIPSASLGLPARVLVVTDEQASDPAFVFPPNTDAIVGYPNGSLVWNPTFLSANAGTEAWYLPDDYETTNDGRLGSLVSAQTTPLFLAPVPDRGEYPFIRWGSRRYLTAIGVDTDADLALLSVPSDSVGWSRSTGQLKFNASDVDRCDPDAVGFDLLYLGVQVYFDGVSLTEEPVRTRDPVVLGVVDSASDYYVPDAVLLPSPGVSGVLFVPDGTGTIPNTSAIPATRPNGSGLVRAIQTDGDLVVFTKSGCLETTTVVEFNDEIPTFNFQVESGRAYVARERTPGFGSKVALGTKDRARFAGEVLYLLQADAQPAQATNTPRIGSRKRGPFTLTGTEVLALNVDGTDYLWQASALGAGTFSATTIAASFQTLGMTAYAVRGRVWVDGASTVSVGFGSIASGAFADRTLSGCAALGFLPGWRATTTTSWLPDGLSFGLFRSPVNLDRANGASDFQYTYRVTDAVVTDSVLPSPVVSFTNPPLEDVAGYDDGVFFTIIDGPFTRYLKPYQDVVYRFDTGRMLWAEPDSVVKSIQSPTSALALGNPGVFGETMHPAVGPDYGLYLASTGGSRTLLSEGTDYLLPGNGSQGIAPLIQAVGALQVLGARGSYSAGGTTFTDAAATFVTDGVASGYRLKLANGESYTVVSVTNETTLVVDRPFPASGSVVSWELYEGFSPSTYDPSILVDVVAVPFSPFTTETFIVKKLTPLGSVPTSIPDQWTNRLCGDTKVGSLSVRFGGGVGDPQIPLYPLAIVDVGVAGSDMSVPDTTNPHFLEAAFQVTVGSRTYTVGVDLFPVAAFTTPLLGDVVEYGQPGSGIEGQIRLGSVALSEHIGGRVYYTEVFRDPLLMSASAGEVDTLSGCLNLSEATLIQYSGQEAYLVEGAEATLGPIQGSVFLRQPMRAYQVLEVEYTRADAAGVAIPGVIVEQLPLFVRLETATRVDARTYTFNPTGRTIRSDIAPSVWVNSRLVTTGNRPRLSVDFDTNTIRFDDDVAATATVRLNYAVVQAFGGEQSYTVSSPPVWRPPLSIPAGASAFTVQGDRTSSVSVGSLLMVGAMSYYVTAVTYDGSSQTTVAITPPSPIEAGTRDPGATYPATITNVPVNVNAGGSTGFLMLVAVSYLPVDKGQLVVNVEGDVTAYARTGHVLDLGGQPTIITSARLNDAGTYTLVNVATPFHKAFASGTDALRISTRPVYAQGATTTMAVGPILGDYELVRYTGSDPGYTLVPTQDYVVDTTKGSITLRTPWVTPIGSEDRLVFRYTKSVVVGPFAKDQRVIYPTYSAAYVRETIPSSDNGYLGTTMLARYTFRSPDAFYVRAVPMTEWMSEVASDAVKSVEANNPHGGPTLTISPPSKNWQFGTAPYATQRRELGDKDRAARGFIAAYDGAIVAFEQILEAIDGRIIGDRDGKFRFFVGQGLAYAPPGYEDDITGILNPRNVWSSVFESITESFGVSFTDPVVDPATATQAPVTLVVSGQTMDPNRVSDLVYTQKSFILNDMDDVVLVGTDGFDLVVNPGKVLPSFTVKPEYQRMWEPSILSRLFPEQAVAFGTTLPGIGYDPTTNNPGVYSFLKLTSDGVVASTFFKEVMPIENPALGIIQHVEGAQIQSRNARGRVWAYSAVGFPELDAAITAAGFPSFTASPRPAIILTPLPLSQFPVDQATGLPDLTQLIANGGTLLDVTTGDPSMSIPRWQSGSDFQVAYGQPSGDVYRIGYTGGLITSILGGLSITPTYPGVFVGEVMVGCVITFARQDGTILTDATEIARIATPTNLPFAPEQADTLYVVAPTDADTLGVNNPPKLEDASAASAKSPLYRNGFDVGIANRKGAFRDITLPSIQDPSPLPLKELTGQNPLRPVSCVEALVDFTNNRTSPFIFPALQGQDKNDSGDYTLPYLATTDTELDRLGRVQATFTTIVETDSPVPNAVYPDEVLGVDGIVLGAPVLTAPPATLIATQDLTPVATSGYTPESGIGDVDAFDLVLIEVGQPGVTPSATGIFQVGAVSTHLLEPPRFISASAPGNRIAYTATNIMTHTGATTGVVVSEVGASTIFDFSSVASLVLNDGSGFPTGGFNNIFNPAMNPFPNGNLVTLELIDYTTGNVLETITLTGNTATGGAGVRPLGSPTVALSTVMMVPNFKFVNFIALGSGPGGPTVPLNFRISVDTLNVGSPFPVGSYTGHIEPDRLTFTESLDFRSALPRGSTHPNNPATDLAFGLSVHQIDVSGSPNSVDAPANVNAGLPFTILARNAAFPKTIGTWLSGYGSVKVMGFEGHGNTPVTATGVTFSAIPSSAQDENGVILIGSGSITNFTDSVLGVAPSLGSLTNVQSGDLLAVSGSAVGDGAVNTGTFAIRHAVAPTGASPYREVFASIPVGDDGWVKVELPRVVSSNFIAHQVTLSAIQVVPHSDSGYNWSATGRIYVFPNGNDLTATVSLAYTGFVVNPDGTATFTMVAAPASAQDATGGILANTVFYNAANVDGVLASGMAYALIGSFPAPLPANNVVGSGAVHGFQYINTYNTSGGSQAYSASVNLGNANTIGGYPATPPGIAVLAVYASDALTTAASNTFQPDPATPVYRNVPWHVDMRGIFVPASGWANTVHGASASAVRCLAPGDFLETHDGASTPGTGFQALAGIFVEPSFPVSCLDMGSGNPKVVDATHSLPSVNDVGLRNPSLYSAALTESVAFHVRRIRRWHEVLTGIGESLAPLRFAYEIRMGTVASVSGLDFTATGTGTQLGAFTDKNVNVNPGDVVRLLDAGGNVLDTAEIASVVNDTTLRLRTPGFQGVTPAPGQAFEVYLRQAPVPHMQSNEQLLTLITDTVLVSRDADPVTGEGGTVSTFNVLTDTGVPDYAALGVRVGDIVLVDPAGMLAGPTGVAYPTEYGTRPFGDTAVPARVGVYVAGAPSELDDNRGFYRVTTVNGANLTVTGITEFTGSAASPVVFGASGQEYAVVPTITASALGPNEPQMALRPTHTAGAGNSYRGTPYSVGPFAYRILRTNTLVSDDTVDFILFLRERMLSWVEEVRTAYNEWKQGSYFVFQRDSHISDLGNLTDTSSGLGVPSNAYIEGITGLVKVAPFANVSDALSILDRRYWCLDYRLDREGPLGGDPYASFASDNSGGSIYTVGSGRPVEPDRIDDVLDRTDKLREARAAWIRYRADRIRGTLPAMARLTLQEEGAAQQSSDLVGLLRD